MRGIARAGRSSDAVNIRVGLVTAADGKPAARIRLTRVRPWPELGTPIALAFLRAVEGALMDPDTDVNTLYRDGKLQTWTLKAAAT